MSENLENKTSTDQENYIAAKKAQYEAESRPSKVSDWPLVGFVEKDGVRYPLYRATD